MAESLYLRKSAEAPITVARGPHTATLKPGRYAEVPDPLVGAFLASGATKRSRPKRRRSPDAGSTGEEE